MFAKETYMERRNRLKSAVGHGLLLFLGNDESGMNYEDNTYPYRQDSSFLYFFGLPYAGLAAVIDIDEDREGQGDRYPDPPRIASSIPGQRYLSL